MIGTRGLTNVRTEHLKHLLRAVHKGDLSCPIDRPGLATVGLLHIADDVEVLRGLDRAGVKVALICTLSERGPKLPRAF